MPIGRDSKEGWVVQGWTPDVIVGRAEFSISCSMRTLLLRSQ
ncbi:hypothetical protein [Leuconostoc mesenteroides]|nr:hypothetical protein [Leuconostoc mesenteroides]